MCENADFPSTHSFFIVFCAYHTADQWNKRLHTPYLVHTIPANTTPANSSSAITTPAHIACGRTPNACICSAPAHTTRQRTLHIGARHTWREHTPNQCSLNAGAHWAPVHIVHWLLLRRWRVPTPPAAIPRALALIAPHTTAPFAHRRLLRGALHTTACIAVWSLLHALAHTPAPAMRWPNLHGTGFCKPTHVPRFRSPVHTMVPTARPRIPRERLRQQSMRTEA